MATIEEVLDQLDPPLKHQCEERGTSLHLTLNDPSVPATVERNLSQREVENAALFQVILLYAVNELRGKGSHAPLAVLPLIDPLKLF